MNDLPWHRADEIEIGDSVHRWGDNLPVVAVERKIDREGYRVSITCRETDGTHKVWSYPPGAQLLVIRRQAA